MFNAFLGWLFGSWGAEAGVTQSPPWRVTGSVSLVTQITGGITEYYRITGSVS